MAAFLPSIHLLSLAVGMVPSNARPPELRKYYGPEWRRYRETLLTLAGHRCAQCGTAHRY